MLQNGEHGEPQGIAPTRISCMSQEYRSRVIRFVEITERPEPRISVHVSANLGIGGHNRQHRL